MPLYETERIRIEKATLDDSPFILELLNSPGWIEFIGDRGLTTTKEVADYIQKVLIDSYVKNGYGLFKMILKAEDKPIGLCGFVKRDFLDHADIGFALLPEYEGNGYAYEAACETMNYGLSALQIKTIFAITTFENSKSKKLLHKIGLHEIGAIHPDIYDTDLLLYSNEKTS
ncbi:MAG: GNAT family N-acetyltransferase [Candidatus Marinimicrobia bacterium]|jgi:RimJ/RimL family protein N-acetyltransferase|nr:GNAT family N-acetyltransferase [Candidatus Neomarinimicrobiota bacterium]MBT3632893.1 GNAT family N-acetyltransferase [Candidatus Neomarinimicrobiota bacterium]MBT3682003.1 GNAT family N-acetyltransferase [Candidatus Neomarinimicrobiota bacterium]MBT3758968.1 GNAT family N-acetyltransferase [Candidatus Neomarinimicrobiota bacterium]MBT3895133.1 GNAT family N-acetyltransferase [Candidatus Neomarinimicrobiota bacterium]